jgi:hypothetical protein
MAAHCWYWHYFVHKIEKWKLNLVTLFSDQSESSTTYQFHIDHTGKSAICIYK